MQEKSNSRWSLVASRWRADSLQYLLMKSEQRKTNDLKQPVLPETPSIRSIFLPGPVGRLEALLNAGSPDATHAAVVCHPHPLYGGTLHNKVVFHAMKALNSFGFPVLRFNFRGTGLSEGEHAGGIGEVDDVRIALDWIEREFTLPVIFAGFSFGAAVGLRAAYADDRVPALIALGLPAVAVENRVYDFEFLRACTKPKLFVSGSRDQFGPAGKLEALVDTFAEPKKLVRIEAGDHFFEGRLKEMRVAIEGWVQETLSAKAPID
jgi:alpha/beta superfamily hydrolase